jgi:hypothetical protein
MNTRIIIVVVLTASALVGCRNQVDPSVELLQNEARLWEDRYYEMAHKYQAAQEQLESRMVAPRGGEAATPHTRAGEPSPASSPRGGRREESPSVGPLDIDLGDPLPGVEGTREPRGMEDVDPSKDDTDATKPWESGRTSAGRPDWKPERPQLPPPVPKTAPIETRISAVDSQALTDGTREPVATTITDGAPSNQAVQSVTLDAKETRGQNFDGKPGDEGVRVVVLPQNAAKQYVPAMGSLSISLIDPNKSGNAASFVRWDFDENDVKSLVGDDPSKGLVFDLIWPNNPPDNPLMKLRVRFETKDGRVLTAEQNVRISLPGELTNRSTSSPGAADVRIVPAKDPPMADTPARETAPAPRTAERPKRSFVYPPPKRRDGDRDEDWYPSERGALTDAPAWK